MSENLLLISPKQAFEDFQNEEAIIIDIRTKAEYAAMHVKNSLLCPLDEIETLIEKYSDMTNKKWYFLCRSGVRVTKAILYLSNKTDKPLYNIEGGILAWQKDNLPVIINQKNSMPILRRSIPILGFLVFIAIYYFYTKMT